MVHQQHLSLPVAPADTTSQPEVLRPLRELVKKDVEASGRGFFELYEKAFAKQVVAELSPTATESSSASDDTPRINEKKAKTRSGFVKLDDNMKGVDLYKLLMVDEDADVKTIQKTYKKVCLEYHPDKVAGKGNEVRAECVGLEAVVQL